MSQFDFRFEYWDEALCRIQERSGFSPRLTLDVFRLRRAVGILATSDEYLAMVDLAVEAGLAGEARRVLDEGLRRQLLGGSSPEGTEHRRIRDSLSARAVDDEIPMWSDDSRCDGDELARVGFALALEGHHERSISFLEQALVRSRLQYPDDVRFRLGLAQLWAGHLGSAEKTLQAIRVQDGTRELARLWLLVANGGK